MPGREKYLNQITDTESFIADAAQAFLQAYAAIQGSASADALFEKHLCLYENNGAFSFNSALSDINKAAEICGVRSETAEMVFILCLTERLKELYGEKRYDISLFHGVIDDLKAKNDECYTVRGVYGTFVGWWFAGYFDFRLFALGRLQFEPRHITEDIDLGDRRLNKGDLSIGVHIPSGKPLDISECEKSLQRAYKMFSSKFPDGTVVFDCTSWLLAPDNRKYMKPDSNIIKFMNLFRITPSDKNMAHDLWRIFGTEDCSDTSKLPKDTSLRRIFAELIDKGEIPLMGKGIIIMRDGKIVR